MTMERWTLANPVNVFLTFIQILKRENFMTKSWNEIIRSTTSNRPSWMDNIDEWDMIFKFTDPNNLKPEYRELFTNIKKHYQNKGFLTPRQANAARISWKVHNIKEAGKRGKGVSGASFRGLPRMVNENIY